MLTGRRAFEGDTVADTLVRILEREPAALPPELIAAAVPLVPVLRRGRPLWELELPLAELAPAPFQKLIVSGGHSAGFDAICDDLAAIWAMFAGALLVLAVFAGAIVIAWLYTRPAFGR